MFGDIPEIGVMFEARVVDQDIEFAQLSDGVVDEMLAIGNFPYITLNSNCAAALFRDFGDNFLRASLVGAVADGYVCAVLSEAFGNGAADALIASSDGDGFTF